MNIPLLAVLSATFLGYSLIGLVLGVLFATLYYAFTMAERVGIKRLAEKFPGAEKRITYWEPRWEVVRIALLISNIGAQVLLIVFAVLAVRSEPPVMLVAVVAVATFCIVVLFQLLPRALSRSYGDRISVVFLPLAGPLSRLLFPLAWPIAVLGHALHSALEKGSDEDDRPTSEEEIRSVVNRTTADDLEEDERQIIQSVFEFGDTLTREIMTPRVNVEALEDTETVGSCAEKVKSAAFSRFPVYHGTLDDARGVVHVKDLLRHMQEDKEDTPLVDILHTTPFVPESMPINLLLQLLRSEQAQMAVVVDEYGGTAGVVTIEDVVEELVGEIEDEYDRAANRVQRLPDGSAVVAAGLSVYEVNRALGITIPEDDEYDSVGGFIYHALGHIPRPGEIVEGEGFTITVQTANARQVHSVRVATTPAPEPA